MTVARRSMAARLRGGIIDLFALAAIVIAVPVAILAVGAPLALAGKAVLRAIEWLFGG